MGRYNSITRELTPLVGRTALRADPSGLLMTPMGQPTGLRLNSLGEVTTLTGAPVLRLR